MKLLGIDVGTSGSRAVAVNETGAVVASQTVEHTAFDSPKINWAEQHPTDWWRASSAAVRALFESGAVQPSEIAAVGLSGQMHGSVLLDARNRVVRPALLWCDGRTTAECDEITEKIGRARLIELVANPALTGFTLPKLLWVRRHEPENWRRVSKVLLPKDYVRFCLSGEFATDVADASGTLMFDVVNRRWSKEILDALEIEASLLPGAFESSEICARVSEAGASATGLLAGTPIVAGAGDQAAGAVGLGVVEPGAVSATIGTSGVVFAATDAPLFDKQGRIHTFCHAVPNRWHVMGVTLAAGLSLRWFRDTFGARVDNTNPYNQNDFEKRDDYDLLCEEAAGAPPGADGVLWTPYLMGERTPHLDANARATLTGLAAAHTRAHIVRAILEGVAFSLKDTFEIFREINVPIKTIKLGGGGARSALWRQIQADVYEQTVETTAAEEGAAYGAALLAGIGVKVWNSIEQIGAAMTDGSSETKPDASNRSVLQQNYRSFQRIYAPMSALGNSRD